MITIFALHYCVKIVTINSFELKDISMFLSLKVLIAKTKKIIREN